MKPNQSQQKAINKPLEVTLKIAAGAGTGKTTVIANRYLKFVQEDKIPPEEILALTFTKKAASEMKKRIFDKIKETGDRQLYLSLYKASISNFHSFCNDIIQRNPEFFELDPDIQVASEVDLSRLRRPLAIAFEEGKITGLPESIEEVELTPARMRTFFDYSMKVIEKARGMMMTPNELEAKIEEDDGLEYKQEIGIICALWRSYEKALKRRKLIDFPAMMSLAVEALAKNKELQKKYVERYRCILVDEFQDTSAAQYELLRILSGGDFARVTVVGDEKQSIYRWRDARVENIRYFGGEPVNLDVNYRSHQEILDLAYFFIGMDEELGRSAIRLVANEGSDCQAITIYHPLEESGSSRQLEAEAVAAWIDGLVRKPLHKGISEGPKEEYNFGDFAVLLRSLKPTSNLPFLEREFKRRSIPFAVVGASASLENSVLNTLMHVLSLLAFPGHVSSLLYLLECEPYSLCDADLMRLFHAAKKVMGDSREEDKSRVPAESGLQARDVLNPEIIGLMGSSEAGTRASALLEMLARLNKCMLKMDFVSFLWEAVEESCIIAELFARGGSEATAESVMKLISSLAKELVSRGEANLYSAIEHLRVITDRESRAPRVEAHMPKDKVKIMTVHQAKGLEFPAVIIPGLASKGKQFDGFYISKEMGLFSDNFSSRQLKDLEEADKYAQGKLQEERCLIYVAMTRAKKKLLISSYSPEGEAGGKATDFFKEILSCLKNNNIPFMELRSAPEVRKWVPPVRKDESRSVGIEDAIRSWKICRGYVSQSGSDLGSKEVEFIDLRLLKAFIDCEHKFYLAREPSLRTQGEYALELSEEKRRDELTAISIPGVDPLEFGDFFHRVLEELMHPGVTRREAYVEVIEKLSSEFDFSGKARKNVVEYIQPIVESFLASPLGKSAKVEAVEKPFYVRVGRAIFTGRLDRLDKIREGYLVIDYKTGSHKELAEKDYAFQIQFYAWALNKILGEEKIRGVICYLSSHPEVVEVDTTKKSIMRVEEAARKLASGFEEGTLEASFGNACFSCDYREFCRIYIKNASGNNSPT